MKQPLKHFEPCNFLPSLFYNVEKYPDLMRGVDVTLNSFPSYCCENLFWQT